MNDSTTVTGWEAAYQEQPSGEVLPEQCLKEAMAWVEGNQVKRVLDVGCGDGRHIVYLAKQGYAVSGIDSAPTAIKRAQQWLAVEHLEAELVTGNMRDLPWADNQFDAIVCIKTVHHQTREEIDATFLEFTRVLKPNGLLLLTAMKNPPPKNWKEGAYQKVEPQTYYPTKGHEKGVPHYGFEEWQLRDALHNFELLRFSDESPLNHRFVALAKFKP